MHNKITQIAGNWTLWRARTSAFLTKPESPGNEVIWVVKFN
jgi:hypothetical protein